MSRVRSVVSLGVLVLFGLLAIAGPALGISQRARRSKPPAFRWRWRLVTAEPNQVAADDRYVVVIKGRTPAPYGLSLFDQQQRTRKDLKAPSCPEPTNPLFGGPWLLVSCGGTRFELYNLGARRWRQFVVSRRCSGCRAPSIGRYWVRFSSTSSTCVEHCAVSYVLQNIATGQLKADPAQPGGRIFDDLSAPSGSSRLCPPLRYPRFIDPETGGSFLGVLSLEGQFAPAEGTVWPHTVPVWALERCHSRLKIQETDDPGWLSSRAFVWISPLQSGNGHTSYYLVGRLLPRLQSFSTKLPAKLNSARPDLVALSQRTVYVETTNTIPGQLWTATLPARAGTR